MLGMVNYRADDIKMKGLKLKKMPGGNCIKLQIDFK